MVSLLEEAARRGLLGGDVGGHLAHSQAFAACVREVTDPAGPGAITPGHPALRPRQEIRSRLADIGSGAGVPGLILAGELAGVDVTLVERREGRATWLEEAAEVLAREGVSVQVRCADVYDLAHRALRGRFDVVTARAFGSPARTAELGGALLRVGGVLVVSEPPDQPDRWRPVDLAGLGLTDEGSVDRGGLRFHVLRRTAVLDAGRPRRRPRR